LTVTEWKLGFHEGNVVKYIARAKHKENELQDLKKAQFYLNKAILNLENSHDNMSKQHLSI
jgi:hypothetical protein